MRAAAALAALLIVVAGCTPAERACTLIGARRGVSVTVDPTLAAALSTLRLTVCEGADCVTRPVDLAPRSGPEASSKVGFAELDELTVGPVRVSATAVVSRRTQRYPAITTTATLVYPNGPGCGSGGPQAQVSLGRDGLR